MNRGSKLTTTGILVSLIIISAFILGAISYFYSEASANEVRKNAIDTIHTNSEIAAHDIAEMLRIRVLDIQSNIEIISKAPMVHQGQVDPVHDLFTTVQGRTADMTDSYFWIDSEGKLLWASSFDNRTLYEQFAGADTSFRDYYITPKQTLQPYITKAIDSTDGIPRLFIAQPIVGTDSNNTPIFKGVIASSVNLVTLGQFLESQVSPKFKSTVGMLDQEGQILYSTDHSVIGQNVFGDDFQSTLPEGLKSDFNALLEESLKGEPGFQDLSFEGSSGTLAYQPIKIDEQIWSIIYVVTPHTFADSVLRTIDNQRNLSTVVFAIIAGMALGLIILVLRWNRNLDKLVAKRTSELRLKTEELEQTNESLLASNAKLERAHEELLVHDKLQKEFVNVAAHELRTPIQPLLGAAELLQTELEEKDKVEVSRAEIEMIVRNAKRLERLSSDILEVSRIESGALKINREDFSLAYIISDAIRDARAQSLFNSEKLTIDYTPDDIFVHADREKTTQVITNLLTNAIKFTDKGTIAIRTLADHKSGFATISVEDSGSGIDPEILPRLFQKFVTRSDKGTGIGLFISKKIVEAHGGMISGKNNLAQGGATFAFSLPLARYELDREKV